MGKTARYRPDVLQVEFQEGWPYLQAEMPQGSEWSNLGGGFHQLKLWETVDTHHVFFSEDVNFKQVAVWSSTGLLYESSWCLQKRQFEVEFDFDHRGLLMDGGSWTFAFGLKNGSTVHYRGDATRPGV